MFAMFVVDGVEVEATRGEGRAQAGACSTSNMQTESVSCAVVSAVRVWWSSGGRGEESPALSAAHLVLEALRY